MITRRRKKSGRWIVTTNVKILADPKTSHGKAERDVVESGPENPFLDSTHRGSLYLFGIKINDRLVVWPKCYLHHWRKKGTGISRHCRVRQHSQRKWEWTPADCPTLPSHHQHFAAPWHLQSWNPAIICFVHEQRYAAILYFCLCLFSIQGSFILRPFPWRAFCHTGVCASITRDKTMAEHQPWNLEKYQLLWCGCSTHHCPTKCSECKVITDSFSCLLQLSPKQRPFSTLEVYT